MIADGARHTPRLNVALIGETARARKGSSRANVDRIMRLADDQWRDQCCVGGLASGEGIIAHLANTAERRMFIHEPELASLLKAGRRDGNIVSPIVRQAWDGTPLQNLTKKDPIRVDGAHISIVGHITITELRRLLTDTEIANGFANRFLWVCVRRSKKLPDGGSLDDGVLELMAGEVRHVLDFGKTVGAMQRSPDAEEYWADIYDNVPDQPGMLGAITARAEAQMLRLSITYALLDRQPEIGISHLDAAKAMWDYCAASAHYCFGDSLGDPIADQLLEALREAESDGLTLTQQRAVFSRHVTGARLSQARQLLEDEGLAYTEMEPTGGRPRGRTYAL